MVPEPYSKRVPAAAVTGRAMTKATWSGAWIQALYRLGPLA
jgi:hypothetical protein